jgi:hypothetical protein
MYKSDSIHYTLTKWFERVSDKHLQYTELLTEHIETSNRKILDLAIELQKIQGKTITKEALAKKEELIKNVTDIEPANIELIEFVHSYKTLLEEIDGFNLDLASQKNLIKMIKSEIEYHDNLMLSLRNLIKSINAVFKAHARPKKKNEAEFELYLKDYSKLLLNFEKDFVDFKAEFQGLLLLLNSEVEQAKKIGEGQEA